MRIHKPQWSVILYTKEGAPCGWACDICGHVEQDSPARSPRTPMHPSWPKALDEAMEHGDLATVNNWPEPIPDEFFEAYSRPLLEVLREKGFR